MTERANPFGSLDDFEPGPAKPKPDPALIDQVAANNGFTSRQLVKETRAVPVPVPGPVIPEPKTEPDAKPEKEKLRQKVFRVTPAQDRELTKRLADLDTTMQDLVLESINTLLQSKGLPPI
jgi:hypothetical protein